MMMSTRSNPSRATRGRTSRRGNTIVLVAGILVLLVILASAYLTRTRAERRTSVAILDAEMRDAKARQIGESLANEATQALFPAPIDQAITPPGSLADSSDPRLSPERNPQRYGIDQDADGNGLPDHPYNFAPYWVFPFTNWPDGNNQWPQGPGAPNGLVAYPASGVPLGEGNPLGNPGFGDTRWLCDHEPLRWATELFGPPVDTYLDAFSHWRHLTNIARPNNGFRIVTDIADVFDNSGDADFLGTLLLDLNVPVEQWLAIRPTGTGGAPIHVGATGDVNLFLITNFEQRFTSWFFDYINAYADPTLIPPNFVNLGDLDGDGVLLEANQERPLDEFVEGTARWGISRFLADADGDGFTDSFWFLVPTPVEKGIRQIVAVRIIDNSAMLDADVATRFDRDDTIGATPADLALVGQNVAFGVPNAIDNYNTGLLDNPANTETYQVWATNPYGTTDQRWLPGRWGGDFLPEIGIFSGSGFFLNADNRLAYWQLGGRQPFSATAGITPFALSDELELRMYHGQNAPFVLSRFERALNTTGTDYAILRSPISREESSEYRDQLGNRELRYDLRHDLTLFNGARNEEMPPWLWWRWDAPNLPQVELANFFAQSRRKLDLRETNPANLTLAPGTRTLRERLPETLALALSDGPSNPSLPAYAGQSFGSYYGPYDSSNFATPDSDFQNTLRLSAAVTANLLAYRSASSEAFVVDDPTTIDIEGAVEVPRIGPTFGSTANVSKFLGMEKQPFFLEAFVAHVYKGEIIPEPYEDQGGMAVHQDSPRSTIAVVQIANPFDEAIDLDDYELSLFGQTADLATVGGGGLVLPPATSSAPRTAIFYAIDSVLETDNLLAQWVDFLDLDSADHPVGTIIVDVNVGLGGLGGTSVWSTDRDEYDAGSGPGVGGAPAGDPTGPAIVLRRKHPAGVTGPSVVVDRIDPPDDSDRDFGDAVNEMKNTEPPKKNPIDDIDPTATGPFGGIVIAPDEDLDGMPDDPYTYWSQWVRVTRAWAADLNGRNGYEPNEQNPRYVFANRAVVKPTQPTTPNERFAASGVRFEFGIDPDGGTGANTWFERTYHRIIDVGGSPSDELVVRKPTFFDMNPDSGLANFPDKGWYGQPQGADDETVDPGSGALRVDQPYPLQMLQKNGDFQQVGELLNVWLYGHELRFVQGATGNYDSLDATGDDEGTVKTFSEFMIDNALVGEDGRVNRLRVLPQGAVNPVIGVADPTILRDLRHAFPDLPAGIRVLDAFVCDGPGFNPPANPAFDARYDNAQGFSGVATPGLVNISTAPLEVLRTMPQMWKLVHEVNAPIANPRIALPEAMIQYRERFSTNAMRTLSAPIGGPDYSARSAVTDDPNLRVSRGFASPNEVLLLDKPAPADVFQTTGEIVRPDAWRAVTAASGGWFVDPSNSDVVESTRVSNDVQDVRNYDTGNFDPDLVAGDVEEANLLHAGISNLITTRSDLFTVYFKVRSFRQREDGRWNALDRDQIVDDSRYVMLVDRSAVNSPSDPPRILYFEKLPN